MSLFVLSLMAAIGIGFYLYKKHKDKKLEQQTREVAIGVAQEKGLNIDFMYIWRDTALVIDRKNKFVFFCRSDGEYDCVGREGTSFVVDKRIKPGCLVFAIRDFDDNNVFVLAGSQSQLADIDQKINATLHWSY